MRPSVSNEQVNIPIAHGSIGSERSDQTTVLFRRTVTDKYYAFFDTKTKAKNMLPRMYEAGKKVESYFK